MQTQNVTETFIFKYLEWFAEPTQLKLLLGVIQWQPKQPKQFDKTLIIYCVFIHKTAQ